MVYELTVIEYGDKEGANMRQSDIVEEIIDIGLKRGALTYDEINDVLPSEFFSLDELQEIMEILQDVGIKIVDFRKPSHKSPRRKTA